VAKSLFIKFDIPSGIPYIQFNPRIFKKFLRQESGKVATDARRLVSRRGVSKPGEFFGKKTGDTQKAIKARVTISGMAAIIAPNKRSQRMQERDFYPTILTYGVKNRIKPRKDPIHAAFDARREGIRARMAEAIKDALEVRWT